jgi:hypothetical protein
MRIPHLRFTVRRLMLVVAMCSFAGWGVNMWRLSCYYSALARSLSTSECLSELEAERSME